MNRTILIAVLCVAGCARAKVSRTDYTDNTFTVCGNKWADASTVDERARDVCRANFRVLQCGDQTYATVAHGSATNWGSTTTATAVARDVKGLCCTYQCEQPLTR